MPEINSIRISVSEAARLFGIDPKTVRRALKAQELRYIVVRGRYKLHFESLVKWSQKKPTVKNKSDKFGLGQYVEKWKINNKHYSPNPKQLEK
ncbi:MAG: helix-turn-helix domain-containing protein [Patescibacteria group bacterium]|nr:helix-turn-helix domain-containing protein [Patescibacteria group bacterium]